MFVWTSSRVTFSARKFDSATCRRQKLVGRREEPTPTKSPSAFCLNADSNHATDTRSAAVLSSRSAENGSGFAFAALAIDTAVDSYVLRHGAVGCASIMRLNTHATSTTADLLSRAVCSTILLSTTHHTDAVKARSRSDGPHVLTNVRVPILAMRSRAQRPNDVRLVGHRLKVTRTNTIRSMTDVIELRQCRPPMFGFVREAM